MVDRVALAEELRDLRYNGLSDEPVCADMEGNREEHYVDVPVGRLAGKIVINGLHRKLEMAAGNQVAGDLLWSISSDFKIETLRYTDVEIRPQIDAVLNDLVTSHVFEQSEADMLRELGIERVSVYDRLDQPTLHQISVTRRMGQ